ncbi:serine/threonine-protein kinase [Enhygromyxa salina]|uniref:Serine/threonine-protein kinase PrkC n=1 Tax=Enhygromyxa salina TaxID=215803 RepID=A0A2S9YXW1_9BACT|nr:serine/threonine-protein kinase [Enhygromyxa salina]PRQ09899.1 Serine/threonine-protein kinase PrkC [Enhygromyxa salina]
MSIVHDDTLPPQSQSEPPSEPQSDLDAMRDVTIADDTHTDHHAPLEPETSTRLNHYVLLSKLGQGGMGVVYAAYDERLDRKVAIKLLRSEGEPKAKRRLVREAQSMARLAHPNVVQIYEIGEADQRVFIVMEFVKGATLQRWLAAQPRSQRDILEVFHAAGKGLAAAHAQGLVHRDFKPDNVMIDADNHVRVMDFGLAHGEVDPEAHSQDPLGEALEPSGLTATGVLMGTPAYMAPEQFEARPTDARTDQFSFCVALWEALHGKRPFAGASLMDLSVSVCSGSVSTPADNNVPSWLRKVVARGLQVEPDARWPSLEDLLDALGKDPTRRRRAVLGTLTMVALALGVAGGVQLTQQRARTQQLRACDDEAQTLRWNPSVEAELAAAFEATALPYARSAWAHTRSQLNDYAHTWSQARRETCVETHVAHRRDEASHALITACLDERRAAFEGLLDAWAELDERTLARATSAAAKLSPVSTCTTALWLTQRMQAPTELRAAVGQLRARLEQVEALDHAGSYEAGLERIEQIETEAVALGWSPLLAEARLARGDLHDKLGDYEAARASVERAYLDAVGAGHEMTALGSATLLTVIVGDKLAQPERGLYWGELARMHVERMGLTDTVHEAQRLGHVGAVHTAAGGFAEATAAHARALQITKATFGAEHLQVALALNNAGSTWWEQGDYDQALPAFLESLRIKQAVLGPQHPEVGVALNNIGAVYWGRGDYDLALASFEQSLSVREAALGPQHPDVAGSLNNVGAVLASQHQYQPALVSFRRALDIQMATLGPDHPDVAGALTNIANILRNQAQGSSPELLQEVLDTHLRALAIWETAYGPDHPKVAMSLNNVGVTHWRRGEFEQALATHRRALAIREGAFGPEHADVAMSLSNIGTTLSSLGDRQAALEHYQRALAIREATLGPDHVDLADSLDNVGHALRKTGAIDEAMAAHERALAIIEASLGPDNAAVAASLIAIGSIAVERGAVTEAREVLERALAIREQPDTPPAELADAMFALAPVRWAEGDRAQARTLAEGARERYAGAAIEYAQQLREVDAWLGAHRVTN